MFPGVIGTLLTSFPQNITLQFTQAFNQFVDPWALNAIGWKYVRLIYEMARILSHNPLQYLVYCVWLVVEILFVMKYIVETRGESPCFRLFLIFTHTIHSGRTLEETAAIFDGEKPQLELAQLGGQAAITAMNLSRGCTPMAIMSQKATAYGSEEWIQQIYTSGSSYDEESAKMDSRRQSQESSIAITL